MDSPGEFFLLVEQVAKTAALHVLHDDHLEPVMGERVVHRNDVRVIQPGTRQGFTTEPLDGGFIARDVTLQYLDGHLPVEKRVVSEPHLGHSATSNETFKSVSVANEPRFEFSSRHD